MIDDKVKELEKKDNHRKLVILSYTLFIPLIVLILLCILMYMRLLVIKLYELVQKGIDFFLYSSNNEAKLILISIVLVIIGYIIFLYTEETKPK